MRLDLTMTDKANKTTFRIEYLCSVKLKLCSF